eukprot:TRINITY_DN8503_c0_g1_i1.p1 TRINITY_DN8503_c0_g1~~TRINITY_DN8503_c0_g1_i1.p1  ORF type:complete len:146 (-),score=58.42 TRINITY_DN8503_c0_g1_i1:101-538(-)
MTIKTPFQIMLKTLSREERFFTQFYGRTGTYLVNLGLLLSPFALMALGGYFWSAEKTQLDLDKLDSRKLKIYGMSGYNRTENLHELVKPLEGHYEFVECNDNNKLAQSCQQFRAFPVIEFVRDGDLKQTWKKVTTLDELAIVLKI